AAQHGRPGAPPPDRLPTTTVVAAVHRAGDALAIMAAADLEAVTAAASDDVFYIPIWVPAVGWTRSRGWSQTDDVKSLLGAYSAAEAGIRHAAVALAEAAEAVNA